MKLLGAANYEEHHPYDIEELHIERQSLRDKIGALQNGIF